MSLSGQTVNPDQNDPESSASDHFPEIVIGVSVPEPRNLAPIKASMTSQLNRRSECFDYFLSDDGHETRADFRIAWILTLAASVVVGLVKGGVSWAVKSLRNLRLDQMANLGRSTRSIYAPLAVMSSYGLLSGASASLVVLLLAPAAGGGGIPDIKAYLNGNLIEDFLSCKTLFARIFGICLVVSCGVMAGPEGPMAHVGMMIMVLIPAFLMSSRMNKIDLFDFATVGSGIGISSAFTAPLAGTLFALEEAASFWHPELISRTLVGAIVAAVVGEYTSAGFKCEDQSGYCVSVWGEFSFTLESVLKTVYRPWEIPLFVVLGGITGLLGVGLSQFILIVAHLYRKFNSKRARLVQVCIVFSFTGIVFCLATLAVSCEPRTTLPIPDALTISTAVCPDGEYNPIALILLESPQYAIRTLFASSSDSLLTIPVLLFSFFLVSLALVVTSAGLPVPAGLFIPLVLCGSLFGRMMGTLFHMTSPGVYALAGSAGLLCGVSRMTLWVAVVIIESSAQIELTIPIVLTVVASKFVSDLVMPESLYERIMRAKNYRFLPPHDDHIVRTRVSSRLVGDIMTTSIVSFFEVETLSSIIDILSNTEYCVFPVVTISRCVVGTVTREYLIEKISNVQSECFPASDEEDGFEPRDEIITMPRNTTIRVSPSDPLSKAYYLFTHLGVSMLLVTDDLNGLLGIITRTNMVEAIHKNNRPILTPH